MTTSFWIQLLDSGVTLAIAGVAIKLIQLIGEYITAAVTHYMSASQASTFLNLTHKVDEIVVTVVTQLSQTTVQQLKEKSADGKLTPEECVEIKQKATEQVIAILGLEAQKELNKAFGDVNLYLDAKIEAVVKEYK